LAHDPGRRPARVGVQRVEDLWALMDLHRQLIERILVGRGPEDEGKRPYQRLRNVFRRGDRRKVWCHMLLLKAAGPAIKICSWPLYRRFADSPDTRSPCRAPYRS